MSEIGVELLANQLINATFELCQKYELRLTEQAARFLRLATESLIKDPPRSSKEEFSSFEQFGPGTPFWVETGQAIFTKAVEGDEEQLIRKEMDSRGEVSFPTIVRVLSDTTHRHLLDGPAGAFKQKPTVSGVALEQNQKTQVEIPV